MKTENLAIILTDIVGYTEATSRLSRKEQKEMLNLHNQLLFPIIRNFGGKVVKTIGDALLLVFRSPTDAMLCSMAMQDALYDFNRKADIGHELHIRIAASLGEVRVARNDVFGEAVNLTARIESITPQDEIYLSEAIYLAMNKAEVPCVEVGLKELKGISEPVKIWQIPRFTRSRLVPEEVGQEEIDNLSYPYGGVHLDVVSSAGKVGVDFEASKKAIKVGLVAAALIAVGVVVWSLPAGTISNLFKSSEPTVAEKAETDQKETVKPATKPQPKVVKAEPKPQPVVKKVAEKAPVPPPPPAPKPEAVVEENPNADLIASLKSGDGAEMRSAARQVASDYIFEADVLQAMADVLEENYPNRDLDRHTADAMAWYCKVLAQSADDKYLPLLESVSTSAGHAKLKKHGRSAYQSLRRNVQ